MKKLHINNFRTHTKLIVFCTTMGAILSISVIKEDEMHDKCPQDIYAPDSLCLGCKPANHNGLQLQSHVQNEVIIAHYSTSINHHALPNVLNSDGTWLSMKLGGQMSADECALSQQTATNSDSRISTQMSQASTDGQTIDTDCISHITQQQVRHDW